MFLSLIQILANLARYGLQNIHGGFLGNNVVVEKWVYVLVIDFLLDTKNEKRKIKVKTKKEEKKYNI